MQEVQVYKNLKKGSQGRPSLSRHHALPLDVEWALLNHINSVYEKQKALIRKEVIWFVRENHESS
jgi:hypothetical protein